MRTRRAHWDFKSMDCLKHDVMWNRPEGHSVDKGVELDVGDLVQVKISTQLLSLQVLLQHNPLSCVVFIFHAVVAFFNF